MPIEYAKHLALTAVARYGHLQRPYGEPQELPDFLRGELTNHGIELPAQLFDLDLEEPAVRRAIESFQDFMAYDLERITGEMHPERSSIAPRIDGVVGPVTERLLKTPRCGAADYSAATAEAQGPGNWRGCHGVGDFHAASIRFTNSPPSWLEKLMPEIVERVTEAYADVGLLLHWDGRSPVNIDATFVGSSNGWIGLAILGGTGRSCNSGSIWCRYLHTYTGGSTDEQRITQWTSLFKHELGHNCGYDHTRGGVMNPGIINGLPTLWRGDVLESSLRQRFGGVPVPRNDPKPPEPPSPPDGGGVTVDGRILLNGKPYRLVPEPPY